MNFRNHSRAGLHGADSQDPEKRTWEWQAGDRRGANGCLLCSNFSFQRFSFLPCALVSDQPVRASALTWANSTRRTSSRHLHEFGAPVLVISGLIAPTLSISLGAGGPALTVTGYPGWNCRLQATTNCTDWTLCANLVLLNGVAQFLETNIVWVNKQSLLKSLTSDPRSLRPFCMLWCSRDNTPKPDQFWYQR